jgi:alkylation response protein AidB-like acyl-CoA dehydrogenase
MTQAQNGSEALLAAAQAQAPRIRAAADEGERERRLPAALVDAMCAAGLFRMLVPHSLGGGEADLATFARVVEAVAGADGSTGWCLAQAAGASTVAAFLEPAAAREIFGDPRAVLAQGPGADARAVVVDGGYRLTGRWAFASGCMHATWLHGSAMLYEADGSPRRTADGAHEAQMLFFPAADAEIVDTWHVSGLRGTGSHDYAVADLFVPRARSAWRTERSRREPGPLYVFPVQSVFAIGFASVALGIARGALDAFLDLASSKVPRGERAPLRENAVVQAQVARGEAQYRSARAFLHETIGDMWEAVRRTGAITVEQRALLRLATTHAIHQAAQAVDAAYHAAGATAIFESQPFERRFRDVHAVTQQIQGRQAHFETVGRVLLGFDPEELYL